MLAKKDNAIHEAVVTMRELTADDKIRLQCEARERYEMDRKSLLHQGIEQGKSIGAKEQKDIDDIIIAEKDNLLYQKDDLLSQKDAEIAALRAQLNQR